MDFIVNTLETEYEHLKQYEKLLDCSAVVSKTDLAGNITYVNDEFCRVSKYPREELIGKNHRILRHPENNKAIFKELWKTISSKKIWKGILKNLTKDGQTYYVKSVVMPVLNKHNQIVEYIAARTNITEIFRQREIIEEQLEDRLTGIQNRTSLGYELMQKGKITDNATLVLINIEGFSDINEYFGYEEGDKLLQILAQKLQKKYKKVFRINGDEFAILCGCELNSKTKNLIQDLIFELENQEYTLQNDKVTLLLSCGVAYGQKAELYKLAHIALKNNKYSNNPVLFYNDNQNLLKQIDENINVASIIRNGIKEDRFIPVFQAIVDNKTKQVVKYECLIRLREEDGKLISPFFFLEHSKKVKLYTKLTQIMIKKSFEKFENESCKFSINFSLQDIRSDEVVHQLITYLEKMSCGNRVIIEVVESEGIENFEEMLDFIKQVKTYGCKIAIDDFGTGYSNYSYLAKLDVDFIKIDGSLVQDIDKDLSKLAIVESILHFSKKMGIKTIAEFVENENIYNILRELGVDYSQGYLFSVPQEELLNKSKIMI